MFCLFIKKKKKKDFVCFGLCWVIVPAHRLSLVSMSGGHSLVMVWRLLIAMNSLVAEHTL